MRLIHLTDPHLSHLEGVKLSALRGKRWSGFASWHKNRRKKYLPGVLEKLCQAVKAENADQIMLSGDLVQIGLESEIDQATRWLASLGSVDKVMLVPGNHDAYARESIALFSDQWSEYLFHGNLSGQFPVVRKLGRLSLIGLSTACVTPLFMARGALEGSQLERLSLLLEQASAEQQIVCLMIHHPPLPKMAKWRKALANAGALRAVLERFPPALILHGHLHHNREQHWGNARIFCTAAASSVSDASYRVIDIEEGDGYWSLRMVLKSIAIQDEGELTFPEIDEQVWTVPEQALTNAGGGSR